MLINLEGYYKEFDNIVDDIHIFIPTSPSDSICDSSPYYIFSLKHCIHFIKTFSILGLENYLYSITPSVENANWSSTDSILDMWVKR